MRTRHKHVTLSTLNHFKSRIFIESNAFGLCLFGPLVALDFVVIFLQMSFYAYLQLLLLTVMLKM